MRNLLLIALLFVSQLARGGDPTSCFHPDIGEADLGYIVLSQNDNEGNPDPLGPHCYRAENVYSFAPGLDPSTTGTMRLVFSERFRSGYPEVPAIRINGTRAIAGTEPTEEDWANALILEHPYTISVRDADFSGEEGEIGPFDAIGDLTGADLANVEFQRGVTMFVRVGDCEFSNGVRIITSQDRPADRAGDSYGICDYFPQVGDPPNLIISANQLDGSPDPDGASVFQIRDAYDIGDYWTIPTDSRIVFAEHNDWRSPPNPASESIFRINGRRALEEMTYYDFDTAPPAEGLISIRNADFSGEEGAAGPHDLIGDITGHDLSAGPQTRVVAMYAVYYHDPIQCPWNSTWKLIGLPFEVTTSASQMEDVVGADPIVNPWNFTPAFQIPDFTGFSPGKSPLYYMPDNGTFADITPFGDGTEGTFDPATAATTAAPDLSIALSGAGFAYWSMPAPESSVMLQDGMLYRFRFEAESSTPTSSRTRANQIRFRVGTGDSPGGALGGYINSDQPNPDSSIQFGARAPFDVFMEASGDGPVEIEMGVYAFVDFRSDQITLRSLTIDSVDPRELASGDVLKNQGGAFDAHPLDATESPGIAAEPFPITGGLGVAWGIEGTAFNQSRPVFASVHGSQASINWPVQQPDPVKGLYPSYATISVSADYIDSSQPGYFAASESALYRIDVWASSSAPTVEEIPGMAIIAISNDIQIAAAIHALAPQKWQDPTEPNPSAIATQARRYSLWFSPQLKGGGFATANVDLQIMFLETFKQVSQAPADIQIHRVVVTALDMP